MEKIIEIAGRSLRMKYTINSLCEVEDRAGLPLDRLMDRQFSATRLLLWGGLTECQPELTVADVGALIDGHMKGGARLEDVVTLCAEGLREAGFFGNE